MDPYWKRHTYKHAKSLLIGQGTSKHVIKRYEIAKSLLIGQGTIVQTCNKTVQNCKELMYWTSDHYAIITSFDNL